MARELLRLQQGSSGPGSGQIDLRPERLAHNTALNLISQVVPSLAGLVAVPFIIHHIGAERFGILSFAWVLLGYFSLLDLGLGRATTKFVAECMGRNDFHELPNWVWTSMGFQMLVGSAGGLLMALLIPAMTGHILSISPQLIPEAKLCFYLMAGSLPIMLASIGLRSVLEAAQEFLLVTYLKIPANLAVFLLPVLAIFCGWGLPSMIALLVASRFAVAGGYLILCLKRFPDLRRNYRIDGAMLRPLLRFGGWVSISSIISTLLVNGDRFFIGALASMTAVGYYTVPAELTGRMLVLPASLVLTLFPAFSSLAAQGEQVRLESLYARSMKMVLLLVGPVLALLTAFSREILDIWLGAEFAQQGALVLQILSIGVLVNSLGYLPLALIQGLGRPDVSAKFHLLELPVYALLMALLVPSMGIKGAAVAWSLRVGMDTALLFWGAGKLKFVSYQALAGGGVLRTLTAVCALGVLLMVPVVAGLAGRLVVTMCLLLAFAVMAWKYIFDDTDRVFLTGSAGKVWAATLGR